MNLRRSNWRTLAAFVLGAAAAMRTFVFAEDYTSLIEGGGTLTGPMIDLAMLGSAILLIGAALQVWLRRIGLIASLLGVLLVLPWYSWVFAAGVWCSSLGNCMTERPLFSFDVVSAVTLVFALTSIVLQWEPRRP